MVNGECIGKYMLFYERVNGGDGRDGVVFSQYLGENDS